MLADVRQRPAEVRDRRGLVHRLERPHRQLLVGGRQAVLLEGPPFLSILQRPL